MNFIRIGFALCPQILPQSVEQLRDTPFTRILIVITRHSILNFSLVSIVESPWLFKTIRPSVQWIPSRRISIKPAKKEISFLPKKYVSLHSAVNTPKHAARNETNIHSWFQTNLAFVGIRLRNRVGPRLSGFRMYTNLNSFRQLNSVAQLSRQTDYCLLVIV